VTPSSLLLGVDGGNTKSIALVATPDGSIVGAGRSSGAADVYAVPVDEAVGRIEVAADEALAAAGAVADPGALARAAFSLAGADWPEDAAELRERLGARWPGASVVNDAIGALRATIPEGPGVVVVLGTGAATAARGPDGATWHSSFWQEADGAHELGVRAIQAVLRAELGIDPATALRAALLEATGEADVETMLHRATARATRAAFQPRRLAGVVLDTAEGGDDAALAIVRRQGTVLGRMAVAAARRVGIDGRFPLALAGGVLRHRGAALRDAIVEAVAGRAPGSTLLPPAFEPAVGALLLAFDAAGIAVTPEVEARLRATVPPAALWDTR
jgi:N-acetylglucosamine kinase-like BadF-type ATPase